MSQAGIKELITRKAMELGFDACRFTHASPPMSANQFQRWLEAGRQGEMSYLARNAHKRVAPAEVLPGVRSLIVLAVSYARGGRAGAEPSEYGKPSVDAAPGDSGLNGCVARYARHDDYHDVLAGPLKELSVYVDELGGAGTRSLWYVDTGPILERDLGQRAGLGFVGKHTNLISRQWGNWILLAEILTTLELEPDAPEKNRCGSCTRCLAACPTGAITAPFELDARRCISYLTIELKGGIPVELRPAIGNRIFGCDDCLEVCPWNRFAQEGRLMQSRARRELDTPALLALLALDEGGFKRHFAGTPLLRSKRRGLLRNVCVALGNSGDARALPALRRASSDSEPLIAEHAAWAVNRVEERLTG
jgi:epoxyqueuosine reductase